MKKFFWLTLFNVGTRLVEMASRHLAEQFIMEQELQKLDPRL